MSNEFWKGKPNPGFSIIRLYDPVKAGETEWPGGMHTGEGYLAAIKWSVSSPGKVKERAVILAAALNDASFFDGCSTFSQVAARHDIPESTFFKWRNFLKKKFGVAPRTSVIGERQYGNRKSQLIDISAICQSSIEA